MNNKSKFPDNCIVIVAARDEASRRLSGQVKNLFRKMGSKQISGLRFREGWAFIADTGSNQVGE